jgi:hypothetical protein
MDTAYTPFTTNGLQCVTVVAPGWTTEAYFTDDNAARLERRVQAYCDDLARYAYCMELRYFGYDPRVLADYDDPESTVLGVDGYPDAIGTWHDAEEVILWEQA